MIRTRAAWLAGAIAVCAACDNGEALPDWSRMITQPKLLPYGESAMFRDGRAMRPLPPGAISRESSGDALRSAAGELERSETGGGDPDGSAGGAGGRAPRGIERSETGGGDPDGSAGGAGGRAPRGIERSETGGGDPDGSAGGAGGRAPRGIDTVPVPVTRALLDRGRRRFAIACATCHGLAGDGDSPVARAMQRRRPPSLHEPRLVALGPAALYRVIASGYGLMPSYAKLVAPDDRWAVVAYVRTLQLAWRVRLAALPPAVHDDATRRLR